VTGPTYFDAFDVERLRREYPVGDAFLARFRTMSADELHALKDLRARRVLERAWAVPFYRRHWGAAGAEPGDVDGLDGLARLPTYDKSDLMAAVEEHPPFGDGIVPLGEERTRPPMVVHTTSGTTGRPQPVVFGPWGREVANLVLGRMLRWQGVGAGDVVHSVYGHGLINGGHYVREAVVHFTEATFLSAGTGVETPSARQVATMRDFGATVLLGFADYLRRLAAVAADEGLTPGADLPIRMISGHLPAGTRDDLEAAWGGVPAFDWYGIADTGCIAGEGPSRDGLIVWEDAHHVEIVDGATGRALPDGEEGDIVVTCLYKDDLAPVVRFNSHDVSAVVPGPDPDGLVFRRIAGFLGRSDNMVKIRGINVYPHALARLLEGDAHLTGEYVCRLRADGDGREELVIVIEHEAGPAAGPEERTRLERRLREGVGISVTVEVVAPGATAEVTGVEARQKPVRLVDERR